MKSRARLLLLAYPFPPSRAIGAVRTWNMARHLAALGWQVNVVTVAADLLSNPEPAFDVRLRSYEAGITLTETGHDLRWLTGGFIAPRWWEPARVPGRFARALANAFNVDPLSGWTRPCLRTCSRFPAGAFDLILATGPPFFTFGIAHRVARRVAAPYVLDYRDPWSLQPHGTSAWRTAKAKREAQLVSAAAGVVIVSQSLAVQHAARFGRARPMTVIGNGFDPDELSAIAPAQFEDTPVVYAGAFYEGKREIGPVLQAIAAANGLRRTGTREIRLHYYGSDEAHVRRRAARIGAERWVVCHGRVPREQALAAIRGAAAAAVITSIHPEGDLADLGILTGKLYEILGLGTRVLLVAPPGSDARRLVDEAQAGASFSGSDVDEMAGWLASLRSGERRAYEPPLQHSWPLVAERLDAFLRQCV